MDKEKWINNILNSAEGIKRAEPNPFLFPKIISRINSGEVSSVFIPRKKAILFFASILLLAVLNMGTILYKNSQVTYPVTAENVTTEYVPSQENAYLEYLK